jgi:hypothetical protein
MKTLFLLLLASFFFPFQLHGQEASTALTKERLGWGEKQFRQMLKDRPLMAPYVKEGDEVWNWAVRKFAGEGLALAIRWDPADPTPIWDSMACGPDARAGTPGWVQITKNYIRSGKDSGKPKSGPMLWGNLLVELFNTQNSARGSKIDSRAWNGDTDRLGFIIEHYLVEMDTLRDAHQFFKEVWEPNCRRLNLPSQDQELIVFYGKDMKPALIEDKVDQVLKTDSFHYKFYGAVYDKNYLERVRKLEKDKQTLRDAAEDVPPPPGN